MGRRIVMVRSWLRWRATSLVYGTRIEIVIVITLAQEGSEEDPGTIHSDGGILGPIVEMR